MLIILYDDDQDHIIMVITYFILIATMNCLFAVLVFLA